MAERIEIVTVTVPAGTAIATPQTTNLVWRQGYPVQIELRIPPGPSGLMGIQILHSGVTVIPHNAAEWLITDAEPVIWPLENFPYNSKYALRAYNLDIYSHTVQVRMLLNEIGSQQLFRLVPEPITPAWQSQGIGGEGLGA